MGCRSEKVKRECTKTIVWSTLCAAWVSLSLTPVPALLVERYGPVAIVLFILVGVAITLYGLRMALSSRTPEEER
nr:MAG TPA: hypothetical protein [Caudoviricetes sp.]